jgi:ribosomal protein L37AE/L43A
MDYCAECHKKTHERTIIQINEYRFCSLECAERGQSYTEQHPFFEPMVEEMGESDSLYFSEEGY